MKKEIVAYITGIVNSYDRTITELKNAKLKSEIINPFINFKAEYSDLLEFVIDIPEDKDQAITDFNMALEDRKIRGTNALLEKTCDGFIEENCKLVKERETLKKEIEVYALSELVWKSICKWQQDEIQKLK